MPAFFCDSRSLRSRLPASSLAVISLVLPLAACEGFPGFGSRSEPVVTPIIIEVPVPQVQLEPEPEKPTPPLPARKPLGALQAKRDAAAAANGHGANGHGASEGTAPGGGEMHASSEPPPPVIGLNRGALIGQFGQPVAEREAAPARVLEFAEGDCQLAAYLYFDTARNDFYVLQYQVNGMTDRNEAADRCLMRIRDAARR